MLNESCLIIKDDIIKIKLVEYVPYVTLTVIAALFGLIGNLLIIAAIIISKELHTATSVIILNLAITDLMVSSTAGLFTLISVCYGREIFYRIPVLCKLAASACFVFCNVSFSSMSLLSFNRYIFICQNNNYKKMFSIKKSIIYCILTWIAGILLDLPYLLSIEGQVFERTTMSCVFNTKKHKIYTNILILSLLITIGFLLPAFYFKIFKSISKIRSCALGCNLNKKTEQKFIIKSTKGLFYSFLFFAFAFFAYFSLVLIKDYQTVIPRICYLYMFMCARANSILNPILYATTNSLFKRSFKRIFSSLFCKRNTI